MEEAAFLEDLLKLRWSVGMGKKEDWKGRTKGVALIHGSRKHGWWPEMEVLYDVSELEEEPDHTNHLMKRLYAS